MVKWAAPRYSSEVKESHVVDILKSKVEANGGEVRKAEWIGRRFCPDLRVMHPRRCFWVEAKSPTGRLSGGQEREIARLRALGEDVVVVRSIEDVLQTLVESGILPPM